MMQRKNFLNMDERNMLIGLRVIAIMYFITLIALQGVVIYRQFALDQSIHDFEDIAVILTFNSLFLISALLYFGAIPVQKIKIKWVLSGYAVIVILGIIFIYLKYNVFQGSALSFSQIFDKIVIVTSISGLLVFFFVIFSILGKRRLEKAIEE